MSNTNHQVINKMFRMNFVAVPMKFKAEENRAKGMLQIKWLYVVKIVQCKHHAQI